MLCNKFSKFLATSLILSPLTLCSSAEHQGSALAGDSISINDIERPEYIKMAVDTAYENVKALKDETISEENEGYKNSLIERVMKTRMPPTDEDNPIIGYIYNGLKPYHLFLDTGKVAMSIVKGTPDSSFPLNFIDIGSGAGNESKRIMTYVKILDSKSEPQQNKKIVNFYNVTGENFSESVFPPLITKESNSYKFLIHNIPAFKIEDFRSELQSHGFDVSDPTNRFDFVLSNLAFFHLVDFPGTFQQICDVMRPGGIMLAGGGCFLQRIPKNLTLQQFLQESRLNMLSLLNTTGWPFIYTTHTLTRDEPGQFMLRKGTTKLTIPLRYAGITQRPVPEQGLKVTAPKPKMIAVFDGILPQNEITSVPKDYEDEWVSCGRGQSLLRQAKDWTGEPSDGIHPTHVTLLFRFGITESDGEDYKILERKKFEIRPF